MATLTVIYDANVLYSASLRDLFVELATTDIIEARWTEEIHEEWMRNLLINRPDIRFEQVSRTKKLMNASVKNCLVQGYETITPFPLKEYRKCYSY